MVGKYKVITLCGSTKFKNEFMEIQKKLTLQGHIVVSVGLFGHSGDDEVWSEGTKEMLDDMHKRKIDMADEIFVINKNGYIGNSTKSEIEYAESKGIPVTYMEEIEECNREYITKEQVKLMLSELLNIAEEEHFTAYDTISHAFEWLDRLNGDVSLAYLLDRYERIKQIVKCEQSATTCEHTRLKSFDMIESILSEEYTRKEYGDLADIIILHDQMIDSGELKH